MKNLLLCIALLLVSASTSLALEKGQPFPAYTVTDAFGGTNTLAGETRFVIIASEKDVAALLNDWLATKDKDYLPARHAEYVSDITPMPGLVASLFALPKMKKLPFKILLARDETFAKTYPAQPGKIAVFALDDRQNIAAIHYLDKASDIESLLEPAAPR